MRAATGAGVSSVFSFFEAALFLEKLFSDFLGEFFDEFLGGFLGGFLPALFDELFDDALPFEALAFLEGAARLAVPVDADFARGYLSFQSVQLNSVNVLKFRE